MPIIIIYENKHFHLFLNPFVGIFWCTLWLAKEKCYRSVIDSRYSSVVYLNNKNKNSWESRLYMTIWSINLVPPLSTSECSIFSIYGFLPEEFRWLILLKILFVQLKNIPNQIYIESFNFITILFIFKTIHKLKISHISNYTF